jgi:rRNA processing protein Gar1
MAQSVANIYMAQSTGTVNDISGTVNDITGTVNDVTGTVNDIIGTVNDEYKDKYRNTNDKILILNIEYYY